MLHKVINFLLAVMFLVFAYLQLNDPDPIVWIPIYGVMAVVCVLAMFRYYPRAILFSLVIFYTLYSFFYIPGVEEWLAQDDKSQLFSNVAKMEHPFIEESREFLGLMINVAVLVVYLIISRKR
jgi:hypothetical protein